MQEIAVAAIIAGLAAVAAALAYKRALAPFAETVERERVLERARAERDEREKPARTGWISRIAAVVERALPITRKRERTLRDKLDRAGVRMSAETWRGACIAVTTSSAIAGFAAGSVHGPIAGAAGCALGAAAGLAATSAFLARKRKRRREAIEKAIPDALERLSTAMSSGMSIDEAFREVARAKEMGPIGEEFGRVDREINLINMTREEALSGMSQRAENIDVTFFVSALVQASREGSSIAAIVDQQSKNARAAWFIRLRERINKIDTKIDVVLGMCFLPAALALTCAPIFVQQFASLGRMLG